MAYQARQPTHGEIFALARRQHGVATRRQLRDLGFSNRAITVRIGKGLHPVWRGVYAIGRPQLTLHGRWMAAVLSCGANAALSHLSAAALWRILQVRGTQIEVSVAQNGARTRRELRIHRRAIVTPADVTRRDGIPVTGPICTLIDIAQNLQRSELEAALNEANKRGLADPDGLRLALDGLTHRPGAARLRELLDRRTFTLTDSALERRFLPLAREAGLPSPDTGKYVNGFKVDFYWEDLGLVVETDGLRYHRTPAQQAKDRQRDQVHAAAGLTPLRFTRAQVTFDPEHVRATLAAVAAHLSVKGSGRRR